MTERMLVTGGAGFIGSNLAAALSRRVNTDVVVVDDFSSGDWQNLIYVDCEVRPVSIDNNDLISDIESGLFTAIFHQGAITDTTVMDQRRMLEVNTLAFARILEASSKSDTLVVYASSAGVYGNSPAPNCIGLGEEPANIYGFSKLSMDRVARRWYEKNTSSIVGLRYFNVYGSGESHKGNVASMVLQLYQQIKAGGRPRLFKNGEQRRDFVYIRDVVAANMAALNASHSGVCNVGSGKSRCFNDMIDILASLLNIKLDVDYIDNPYDFFQNHTEADISMTQDLLNWSPQWSLEDGMDQYIRLLERGYVGPVEAAQ